MSEIDQIMNLHTLINGRSKSEALEFKLRRWAKTPSDTETEKCDRAVRMVKNAIASNSKLKTLKLEVFAKGSYANRTNIPSDSDVDVAVVNLELYSNTYPDGVEDAKTKFGFESSAYSYSDFKSDVACAVRNYFGDKDVTVGKKAIQVHSNSCRVDADVVPHAVHRRFNADGTFVEGVAIVTPEFSKIFNWPEQDYANGVRKNDDTGKRYKALVRVLKNLRGEMRDKGYKSAENVPSYLIACLVWSVPDYFFNEDSYTKMTEDSLAFLVM